MGGGTGYSSAMAKNTPMFNAALEPLEEPLPTALAASVGRAIARHSYLDWLLGQVLYSLLEISIKQGRAVVQRPAPREYVAAVQGLYAFHKLESAFDFEALARRIERADRARDLLADSVYMQDMASRDASVHLVRGSWARGTDLEAVSRGQWPETPVLDRKLLAKLGGELDAAVKSAERLRKTTDDLLRRLHEARRTNPRFNRRRSDR